MTFLYLGWIFWHYLFLKIFGNCLKDNKAMIKLKKYSRKIVFGFEGFVIRTIIELSIDISI